MDSTEPVDGGPVLAYPVREAHQPPRAESGRDVDGLLASHGLRLDRMVRPATGQTVLRLIERTTGRPPARVPAALAAELATRAGLDGSHRASA